MWVFLKDLFGKVPSWAKGPMAILLMLIVLGAGVSITTPEGSYTFACTHADIAVTAKAFVPEYADPGGDAPTRLVPLSEESTVMASALSEPPSAGAVAVAPEMATAPAPSDDPPVAVRASRRARPPASRTAVPDPVPPPPPEAPAPVLVPELDLARIRGQCL